MKEIVKKFISGSFSFVFIIFTIFIFSYSGFLEAAEIEHSTLIKKVSKDYTKKFCNAIAFGLSKESAMNFSYEENKQVFKKRKEISNVNKELLAEEIASSVIEGCGYPINLSGEAGVLEFKSFYLEKDKEASEG